MKIEAEMIVENQAEMIFSFKVVALRLDHVVIEYKTLGGHQKQTKLHEKDFVSFNVKLPEPYKNHQLFGEE